MYNSRQSLFVTTLALLLFSGLLPLAGSPSTADEPDGAQRPTPERDEQTQPQPDLAAKQVDYARDIVPIFEANCIACHNAKNAEGGLNLDTHEALMKGGYSDLAVVAGDLEASYLMARVSGAEEPWMPPDDNQVGAKRLTPEELKLLEAWILQGAEFSENKEAEVSMNWQTLPARLKPTYAIAASDDGNYIAFGNGNRVIVAPQSDDSISDQSQVLVDPNVRIGGQAIKATHLDVVQSIAFSPDSQVLVTGGYRTLKIWRRDTHSELQLTGLPSNPRKILPSPDGRSLAIVTGQGQLEIVDMQRRRAERFLSTASSQVQALVWIDERQLLTCNNEGQLQQMHLSGSADQPHAKHGVSVSSLSVAQQIPMQALVSIGITPENKIYGVSQDRRLARLRLSDARDASRTGVWELLESPTEITAIAAGPADAECLLIARENGQVICWNPQTQKVTWTTDAGLAADELCVAEDGQRFLAYNKEQPAKLFNAQDGKLIAALNQDYAKQRQTLLAQQDLARQRSRIGILEKRLPQLEEALKKETEARDEVQESREKAAKELKSKQQMVQQAKEQSQAAEAELEAAEKALAAAMQRVEDAKKAIEAKQELVAQAMKSQASAEQELAKREQALAAAEDSFTRVKARIPALKQDIKSETGILSKLQQTLESLTKAPVAVDQPIAVAFAPGGSHIAVCGRDSDNLEVFSSQSGQVVAKLQGDAASVSSLCNLSGNALAAFTTNGQMRSWSLDLRWQLKHTLGTAQDSPFSDRITALDFSPDGSRLAVGSGPPSRFGELKLLDTQTWEIAQDFGQAHSDTIFAVAFSPDGRLVASGGADKLCKLFDLKTGNLIRNLEGHTHHVLGVAWKDDGRTLATASADQSVKIWKAQTGEQERTIGGFGSEVTAIQFIGNSEHLATASADHQSRVHAASSGKQLKNFHVKASPLYAIAVAADQQSIIAGGQSGQAHVWNKDTGELLRTIPKP